MSNCSIDSDVMNTLIVSSKKKIQSDLDVNGISDEESTFYLNVVQTRNQMTVFIKA